MAKRIGGKWIMDTTDLARVDAKRALERIAPAIERASKLAEDSSAEATRTAYGSDWREYEAWCKEMQLPTLPPAEETISTYLASMEMAGRAVSTIERRLFGILDGFRSRGHAWNPTETVHKILEGIRRTHGVRTKKKKPVLDSMLEVMVVTQDETTLAGLRNRSLLTLGWASASRRSELAVFQVENVEFVAEGLILLLPKSKPDQRGEGFEKGIPFTENRVVCPVRNLKAWLLASKIASGPIYRGVTRAGTLRGYAISDRTVANVIKAAAERAGFDPALFAGHSLRSGLMSSAADHGKPLDAIMNQSGHKSERVARGYIHRANLFKNNAAKGIL